MEFLFEPYLTWQFKEKNAHKFQVQTRQERSHSIRSTLPRSSSQGSKPGIKRPLRETATAPGQAAQGEDTCPAQDQEPRVRRGLHFLRDQLQSANRHHAPLRRPQLRPLLQRRHNRRSLLRPQHRRHHPGGEPTDGALQGNPAEELESASKWSKRQSNRAKRRLRFQIKSQGRGELLVSLCWQPAANRLTVVVLKARNLPKMDVTGLADPYVKIYLLYNEQRIAKKKTHVKKRTLSPVFNESFVFDIPTGGDGLDCVSLEFLLLDWDRVTKNEVMNMSKVCEIR